MIFKTKGQLLYEVIKIKNAAKSRDAQALLRYQNEYLAQLKVSSREIQRIGPFTLFSENISYHLLSSYLLLDLIDHHWNGRKFFDYEEDKTPPLMEILESDIKLDFNYKTEIEATLIDIQRITKHQLHIFLLPLGNKRKYIMEASYPGNILILFPHIEEDKVGKKEDPLNGLYRGIGEFYFQKQLRDTLPLWAGDKDDFLHEFVNWCKGLPSMITAKK